MAASSNATASRFRLRLSLTAAGFGAIVVAALIFAPGLTPKTESEEINVFFHGFQDSRGVTVLSPTFDLSKDFTDRTSLKVKFGVDGISASSDSCARCHPDGITSGRAVGSATLSRKYGDTTIGIGGEFSQENFYRATTVSTSLSRSLNQANTTIAGGYSFSYNQPVLHPSEFAEKQYAHNAYLSLSQTLTRTTVAQVGVEVARISGFQTNPYLRTSVNGVMVPSQAPDLRDRYTFTARVKQALPGATYLDLDYRRYHDTWEIDSNSIGAGLSHRFGTVLASGSVRLYDQTGAYFYAPSYVGDPTYYTGDFRLFPFTSNLVTGRVAYAPRGGLWGMRPGTTLTLQYERYWSNHDFNAAIFTGGITIPFGHKTP